ncbi:MAG: tetratricopeptide repeat protein [Cyclobacteriaceae bacterium]|nr:tetratricopeptide repeat protein [Cyclobacteriaceae bacterium]UYN85307.1 MAG: tetratricopeptide repeat protein [Cyclobacteriaceae bacterium]
MKKVVILLLIALPLAMYAQKPLKPNLNKALTSWKEGKLKDAKDMIDVCATDPKLSLDAKTWFYKGLIYASLDTTSNKTFKALSGNALQESLDAFAKSDELNKNSKNELFYQDNSFFPVTKSTAISALGGYYINEGAKAYQDDDYEAALKAFEKSQKFLPKDTTAYFYAGYVAYALEEYDKALSNFNEYNTLGGKSADAYSIIINIVGGVKEDKEKALALTREARKKHPNHKDFPLMEIGYLIDLDKTQEAKGGLEQAVKNDPTNKTLHFYLGYVNSKLDKFDDAKKNFEAALKVDPTYFDAQYYLAQLYLIEADKIKREMNNLGISAADKKKKVELDAELVRRYKEALPYWEKAEKLNPSDTDVLDKLSIIYYYLGEDAKAARVEKRLKELGIE